MEEDLDHILLDQLHSSRRIGKVIKRLKKIMKDPSLEKGEKANHLRQKFFEDMIENKSLLDNKSKKKKTKAEDILDRNPMYYLYRNTVMATAFSYMYFTSAFQTYFTSYFAKNKNEKNNKES
jgi:hypothetical protein